MSDQDKLNKLIDLLQKTTSDNKADTHKKLMSLFELMEGIGIRTSASALREMDAAKEIFPNTKAAFDFMKVKLKK